MKDKSVAIIGAGELACEYAHKAREMGIVTHCFAWEQGAIAKNRGTLVLIPNEVLLVFVFE